MAIPNWLAQHLVDQGRMDVNGVGRRARAKRCPQCRQYVLAGLDADLCAEAVMVDATALSALGEALALTGGRNTYALRRSLAGFRLDHRHRWEIASRPAGSPGIRYDVVARHECGAAPPPDLLTAPSVLRGALEKRSTDEHCPY